MNRHELLNRTSTDPVTLKAKLHDEIDQQIEEFLANGGEIQKIDGFTFRSKEEVSNIYGTETSL